MRGAWVVLCVGGVWAGCEAPKPPAAKAPVPEAPAIASAPKAPRIYKGEGGIQVAEPEVVASAPGFEFSTQAWKIGSQEGVAWRVRLDPGARMRVVPSEKVRPLREFDWPFGASAPQVMINGGFYEFSPGGDFRAMGLVRTSNKDHSRWQVRGGSGVLWWSPGAGVDVMHRKSWKGTRPKPPEALQSIDRLVDKGASLVKERPDARQTARGAVALDKGGHVWVVAVSSRAGAKATAEGVRLERTAYSGMTLGEFARYLVEHVGAQRALNMDGSVSTQMAVRWPSGGFQMLGERGTINAVALGVGEAQVVDK